MDDATVMQQDFTGVEEVEAFTSLEYYDSDKIADVAATILKKADRAVTQVDYVLKRVVTVGGTKERAEATTDAVGRVLRDVAQIIASLAPIASEADNSLRLGSSVLRLSKRLYAGGMRMLANFAASVGEMTVCPGGAREFLGQMTKQTTDIVGVLLLVLQQKQEIEGDGDKKKTSFLSEAAIRTHGKIASELVFERERYDLTLGKVAKKARSGKNEALSEFFEEQVVILKSRDFKIEEHKISEAKMKESKPVKAPKKEKEKEKKTGKKRKSEEGAGSQKGGGGSSSREGTPKKKKKQKKEKSEKKKKRVKKEEEEEEEGEESGDGGSDNNDNDDDNNSDSE